MISPGNPNEQRVQPVDTPRQTATKAKIAIGSGIAAAVALAIAVIAPFEGKVNDPHWDRFAKIHDVCYGETRVEMRHYSDIECLDMLNNAVGRDFAPKVFACVPALRQRPNQAAAAISLSYNIGTAGFCKSTAARLMNAGDWPGGCRAIARFNRAGGKVVRGLVNRRAAEVALCLRGITR